MSDETAKKRRVAAGRSARGLLGTLFTGTLVVVAGFAIGVVAGLALEDPGLVKDYVAGDTREIELAPGDGVVAAAPAADPMMRPQNLVRAGFSVQVGAFADVDTARELAELLEKAGYPVYVAAPEADAAEAAAPRWRVRVGPVSTRKRAERVARELKSERSLPTWVLDEAAS